MLKSELAERLSSTFSDVPEHIIVKMVNTIIEEMTQAMARGDRIEIREFGSFYLSLHAPAKIRNPRTGETFMSSEKYYPRFRISQKISNKINQKDDKES